MVTMGDRTDVGVVSMGSSISDVDWQVFAGCVSTGWTCVDGGDGWTCGCCWRSSSSSDGKSTKSTSGGGAGVVLCGFGGELLMGLRWPLGW